MMTILNQTTVSGKYETCTITTVQESNYPAHHELAIEQHPLLEGVHWQSKPGTLLREAKRMAKRALEHREDLLRSAAEEALTRPTTGVPLAPVVNVVGTEPGWNWTVTFPLSRGMAEVVINHPDPVVVLTLGRMAQEHYK